MKLIQVDPKLIKKPTHTITVIDDLTSKQIYDDMINPDTDNSAYFISTVSDKDTFIAVDNLSVLDAALKAKLPKITVQNYGKKNPLLLHLNMSCRKEIVNPMSAVVVADMVKGEIKNPDLILNPYIEKALKLKFDESVIKLLDDLIDKVFKSGIRQPPSLVFFAALEKLDPEDQKTAIQNTLNLSDEMTPRFFLWPTTSIFNMMVEGVPKTASKIRESATKNVPSFECECGKSYSVINDAICDMEEKDGCLIVHDRVGVSHFMIPESGEHHLGIEEGKSPRFSMFKNSDELKKLKFDGPCIIVRLPSDE